MSTKAFPRTEVVSDKAEIPSPRWRERLQALKNVPPVLKFVWEAAPGIVVGELASHITAALVPLGALIITRHIIDHIVALRSNQTPLPHVFWWLVAAEFILAAFAAMLMRVVDFCDTALAERFMRHISVRLMKHAANLDLIS